MSEYVIRGGVEGKRRWGVRRFFVKDPNGLVLNVVSHRGDAATP